MAKSKDEQGTLAQVEPGKGQMVAHADLPESLRGGALGDGEEPTAEALLSTLHLYQGTAQEQTEYAGAGFEIGDFVEPIEGRNFGKSVRICPLLVFTSYVKWVKGSQSPVYSTYRRDDVPPADLMWGDDGTPPACTVVANCVCLIESGGSVEPMPYLFRFKRTGYKAYTTVMQKMEYIRGRRQAGRGEYEIGSTQESGDNGPYQRVTLRYIADGPSDALVAAMIAAADEIDAIQSLARQHAEADDAGSGTVAPASEAGAYDAPVGDDGVPF